MASGSSREGSDAQATLSEVEVLMALAQLDLETALAYEAAAEVAEDEEIEEQLRQFARDHRRHIEGVARAMSAGGGAGLSGPPSRATGLFAELARLSAPLGAGALVLTLLADEQLTNLTYEDALAYEWDHLHEAMLEQFRAEEERHMRWLSDKADALHRTGPDQPSPSA
jgi:rubrerythrin